jgi:hypothetical protein
LNQNGQRKYPRKLTELELQWLLYLLPEDRALYSDYRKKISSMLVIGEGRFGEGNLVLGYESDEPDLSYSSLPVFAAGQIKFAECTVQISIHEFFDNKIEISISNLSGSEIPAKLTEISRWSYSYWKPGSPSPFGGDSLREINISKNKGALVLAVSPKNRSVWLYDSKSGANFIIPVTNFINELLRGNTKVDKSKGIDMNFVFSNLDKFSDDDFVKAFVQYNRHWRKVELPDTEVAIGKEKKGLFKKIFR